MCLLVAVSLVVGWTWYCEDETLSWSCNDVFCCGKVMLIHQLLLYSSASIFYYMHTCL